MKKIKNNFSLNNIWILLTILLSFHYYLSYRWINGLLESYDLKDFSIITIQDVMFPFVDLNYTIIGFCSIGFIIVFYIQLVLKNKTYSRADKIFQKNIKETFRIIFTHKSLKSSIFKILSALIMIITSFILFKYYLNIPENGTVFFIWIIVLFIIMPIVYVIWVEKRSIILGFYIFMTFLWSNKFIDKIIVDAKDIERDYKIEISFKYEGDSITTNDSLVFLYKSYKYIILRDLRTNKNKLFESEKITFLETKKTNN